MNIGRNTESGQALEGYIARVESVRASKKDFADQETAIIAEAKSNGFVPAAIRAVLKIRAMKPHVRQEAEAILDTYLHTLGMIADTPLFRQVGLMDVDRASRDEVIEALKKFVPDNGSITVEAGGRPVRLTRDDKGEVTAVEVVERPAPTEAGAAVSGKINRPPPPDVDAEGAEQLGRVAFKANEPIIANPFPFGDERRPKWDGGWRAESGTDGMGPKP